MKCQGVYTKLKRKHRMIDFYFFDILFYEDVAFLTNFDYKLLDINCAILVHDSNKKMRNHVFFVINV